MQLTPWPHLYGGDTWIVIFSLTAIPKNFRKGLMGQESELAIWSTRGGLRLSKEGEYKEERPHYREGSDNLKKRETL